MCEKEKLRVNNTLSPFNLLPHNAAFLRTKDIQLWKTLWEKKKLPVTNNFSFSHNAFYPFTYFYFKCTLKCRLVMGLKKIHVLASQGCLCWILMLWSYHGGLCFRAFYQSTKCHIPNIKSLRHPVSEKKNQDGILCSYVPTCDPPVLTPKASYEQTW